MPVSGTLGSRQRELSPIGGGYAATGACSRPSPLPPRTRQPLPACPPPRRLRAPRRLDAPPHHRAKASRPRWRSRTLLAPRASPPLACPVVPPPPLHPCLGGPLAPRRTRSTHLSPFAPPRAHGSAPARAPPCRTSTRTRTRTRTRTHTRTRTRSRTRTRTRTRTRARGAVVEI